MNINENHILAVIDPTRVDQWALQKAIVLGKSRNKPKIYAFLCVNSVAKCNDPDRLRAVVIRRHQLWLEEVLASYSDADVDIEPVVEWHSDWRDGICIAAEREKVGIVVKRASGNPNALASSDRRLIRGLEGSALFLVKHDPIEVVKNVLIAIDFNATDDAHKAINTAIIKLGQSLRDNGDSIELHSISAHEKAEGFKHPPDIAKILDVTRAQAHVCRGAAGEVIPDMANKIGADLVIVGSVGRRGLAGVTIGNTAEKILTDIKADVLVLVREIESERAVA